MPTVYVNGLPLPPYFLTVLNTDCWRRPSDTVLRVVVPFIEEPLHFLGTPEEIQHESTWPLSDDPSIAELLHITRGSTSPHPVMLPWLDIEQAVLIAVNRFPGDDVAVALDYRRSTVDPCVVATDWNNPASTCYWREVQPQLSQFLSLLGIMCATS